MIKMILEMAMISNADEEKVNPAIASQSSKDFTLSEITHSNENSEKEAF